MSKRINTKPHEFLIVVRYHELMEDVDQMDEVLTAFNKQYNDRNRVTKIDRICFLRASNDKSKLMLLIEMS